VLQPKSHVLELGCGISGIISLVLAPRVQQYLATDQEYVLKHLRQNIADNLEQIQPSGKSRRKKAESKPQSSSNIVVRALDWETDNLTNLYHDIGLQGEEESIDLIISCDCIYNEALVDPLVNACKDICSLAPASKPTVCVIAQQLRSPDVFEAWLVAFHKQFHVWRVPEELLIDGLKENSGFILHIGILRSW
jgi:predicted nicotinamide N-methyase